MANNEKLNEIKEIIKAEYKDKLSDGEIDSFAGELYYSLFVGEYELSDMMAVIYEYESADNPDYGEVDYIFSCMIDLLDSSKKTAQRLYDSFMYEMDYLDTFLKLINENEEFLSAEQIAKAKEKAFSLFDREILELYGITE